MAFGECPGFCWKITSTQTISSHRCRHACLFQSLFCKRPSTLQTLINGSRTVPPYPFQLGTPPCFLADVLQRQPPSRISRSPDLPRRSRFRTHFLIVLGFSRNRQNRTRQRTTPRQTTWNLRRSCDKKRAVCTWRERELGMFLGFSFQRCVIKRWCDKWKVTIIKIRSLITLYVFETEENGGFIFGGGVINDSAADLFQL